MLTSAGALRLRDVTRPEHIFELSHADLDAAPPSSGGDAPPSRALLGIRRRRVLAVVTGALFVAIVGAVGLSQLRRPETSPAEPGPGAPSRAATTPSVWRPAPGTSWQIQLEGNLDLGVDVSLYEIDLFDSDAAVVRALHDKGRKVICYVSAGTWEPWREDAELFPKELIGNPVEGFAEERWLDIRQLDNLRPIIQRRFDLCRQKGFDGVDPDNVDGFQNDTGFQINSDEQLAFNFFLAQEAHLRGLAVALKNDVDQFAELPVLAQAFDFAVNEECFLYKECSKLLAFRRAGKAVLHIEYDLETKEFCPESKKLGFSSLRKRVDLKEWREPCPR